MTETDLLRAVNGASDQQLIHSERARPGRRLPALLAAAAACAALFLLLWPPASPSGTRTLMSPCLPSMNWHILRKMSFCFPGSGNRRCFRDR